MERIDPAIFEQDEPFKVEGYIDIPTDDGGVDLPVYVLQNGRSPRITFIGAQHSCEYSGADALMTLIQDFRDTAPSSVKGSIVCLPVANVPGFPVRALNVSRFDGSNLNRSYPGDPQGTVSERIAHAIWSIAKTGNYVLDLHGGDMTEDVMQYAEIHLSPEEAVNRTSLELAACFDLDVALFSVAGTDYAYPDFRSLYGLAQENGIPAAIVEAGSSGISDAKSLQYFREGIRNVLAKFGFMALDEGRSLPEGRSIWTTMGVSCITRANTRGIFKSHVKAGERVCKGQLIGQILDYFGNVLDSIEAPRNGIVSLVQSAMGKDERDMLYMVIDTDNGETADL